MGAVFEIDYDLDRREAVLRQVRGQRHQLPPDFALPRLPGFAIKIEHRGTLRAKARRLEVWSLPRKNAATP